MKNTMAESLFNINEGVSLIYCKKSIYLLEQKLNHWSHSVPYLSYNDIIWSNCLCVLLEEKGELNVERREIDKVIVIVIIITKTNTL